MNRYKTAILVGSLRRDSLNRKVARSICAFADWVDVTSRSRRLLAQDAAHTPKVAAE